MKTKKELEDSVGKLTDTEVVRMRFIVREMESLINKKNIDEDSYKSASNILNEVRSIRELYLDRLINLYKRGSMVS